MLNHGFDVLCMFLMPMQLIFHKFFLAHHKHALHFIEHCSFLLQLIQKYLVHVLCICLVLFYSLKHQCSSRIHFLEGTFGNIRNIFVCYNWVSMLLAKDTAKYPTVNRKAFYHRNYSKILIIPSLRNSNLEKQWRT